jgi:hypothetical protein
MRRLGLLSLGVLTLAAVAAAQTPRTGRMMRDKLVHSQKILEALTTSNQDLLTREADALAGIAHSPQWTAELRTPELSVWAENFITAVNELDAAAKSHDFDGAATAYTKVTASCYQCHRRLKDNRLVR